MHTLKCTNPKCNKSFESKRKDAKFCSDKCTKAVKRTDPIVKMQDVINGPLPEHLKIVWVDDIENFCNKNNITPQDLMDFYRKYKPKVALLGLDQKKLVTDTPGPNLTYLEQRRKQKSGAK